MAMRMKSGTTEPMGASTPQIRGTTPAQAVETFLALLQDRLPSWLRLLHDLRPGHGDVTRNLEPVALAGIHYYTEIQAAALPAFVSPILTVRFRQAMRESELGPEGEVRPLAAYLAGEQELGRIRADVHPESTARLLLAGCFRHAYYEIFTGADSEPSRPEAAEAIVRELRLDP